MTDVKCDATFLIDFDSIDCYLPPNHYGPHHAEGDGGRIFWTIDRRPKK